jgi:inner membrane protein
MMSVTHCAIAVSGVSIALGTANPGCLVLAALGSQLPDLDTTTSLCGTVLFPIARQIEKRFAHRTLTHSFMSTGIVALLASPLWIIGWQYWFSVVCGQFLGWFADCFTKSGCAAFFPNPARLVIPGNPKARLSTHSPTEYWVLVLVVILGTININLSSAGGVAEHFTIAFFRDSRTAAQQFQRYGATRQISAWVKGMHSSGQPINEQFTIIDATVSDVIGESQLTGKLYKIGEAPDSQIHPTKTKTILGNDITVTSTEQTLHEIGVMDWLNRVPQNSYISGSLLLDDMADVRLTPAIGEYPALRVYGGRLELSNARPSHIAANLREFWILSGSVVVKVRK